MYYGEMEDVEVIDWEEIFENYNKETKRLEKEREEKIERKEKLELSWELLRECTRFLKENEKTWKKDGDNQLTERQKKEIKNKEKQAQARRKSKTEEKQKQKRIDETWQLLPAQKRQPLIEEEKRRRLELREMKLNIWKKWRREPEEKRRETAA